MSNQIMKCFVIFLMFCVLTFPVKSSFAEPQSYEDFMKTYKPILDRVYAEKLSPHKQIDIGLLMIDVVCFNGGTQVLQLSSQSYVACVNPETAPILVQRGWGAVMYDETRYSDGHGYECSLDWIIQYDKIKPKNSELIYSLRYAMNNIQESLIWHPIIVGDNDGFTITMHSGGNYSQEETKQIIDSLNSVTGVSSVEIQYGACI